MIYYKPRPIANIFKLEGMCDFLSHKKGDVIEVGVYSGGSLIYIAERFPDRVFYGYDTFAGLPAAGSFDNYHQEGDFKSDYHTVEFICSKFPNIFLQKCHYPIAEKKSNIIMAHLDVDLYDSTFASLCHLSEFILSGGRIYCDDVFWKHCHGATKALHDFCLVYDMSPKITSQGQCYLQF